MAETQPSTSADIQQLLAQVGLRATPPRVAIVHVLRDAMDDPDALTLLCRAQRIEPRTSLGTVYRFLRELEQHKLASSRPVAHERALWTWGATGESSTANSSRNAEAIAAMSRLAAAYGYRLVPAQTG
jgi:Fur family ferric uptake transcriptional regulator